MSDIQKVIKRLNQLKIMFKDMGKNEMAVTCEFASKTISDQAKEIERLKEELDTPSWQELDKWR